jgi:hypothetical protein
VVLLRLEGITPDRNFQDIRGGNGIPSAERAPKGEVNDFKTDVRADLRVRRSHVCHSLLVSSLFARLSAKGRYRQKKVTTQVRIGIGIAPKLRQN